MQGRRVAFLAAAVGFVALGLAVSGCKQSAPPAGESATTGGGDQFTKVPLGLPELPVPKDNPMTVAKVELGKLLYFDKRLSKDGTLSCATCHDPTMAWAEHRATSQGIKGQLGERNAPTVINAAYLPAQFWDGRAATLEEQALGPIENPVEMGNEMRVLTAELQKDPDYQKRFKEVFGTEVTNDGVAKAIAAFERTILSGNSPYDRFKAGDKSALTDQQKRGMSVFMDKAQCSTCHDPDTGIFTNGKYYNVGIGMDAEKPDPGRKNVTGKDSDMGKFRVAPLRDVAKTAPYFHDGSVKTLAEAAHTMATGGIKNPHLSPMVAAMAQVKLTDDDMADLVAFLEALSGEYPVIEPPK